MKVLLDSLKGLNTIWIIIQNEMIHLKTIFWLTEFIAVNIIQVIVFYGKALKIISKNLSYNLEHGVRFWRCAN